MRNIMWRHCTITVTSEHFLIPSVLLSAIGPEFLCAPGTSPFKYYCEFYIVLLSRMVVHLKWLPCITKIRCFAKYVVKLITRGDDLRIIKLEFVTKVLKRQWQCCVFATVDLLKRISSAVGSTQHKSLADQAATTRPVLGVGEATAVTYQRLRNELTK